MPVRYPRGQTHGFLVLRDLENKILATRDLSQFVNGDRVTSEFVMNFKDGSLHQETTVFSQRSRFEVLTCHLVQKGPSFKRASDTSLNISTGEVITRSTDEHGKEKASTEKIKMPSDVANGLLNTVLSDTDPKAPKTTLSMVVATPKPRIVKLEITSLGEDSYSIAGSRRKAVQHQGKHWRNRRSNRTDHRKATA